ncbi:acetyl-CoA carboxylase [Tsukamurella spumae]|uniref:Biotin carboxyl carrier protein of acetyl-CoA carboxylase n=1 Tax=Tsukamurella spumae TaxID=44753 RepID=A0A846X6B9_9ACTN|nr:acetyl-CoA carboxylase [Tsukamurella spumae]NKY19752.1 biotin carboxyl carrier domain-containing protein [Tsukamurella spumae]
MSIHEVPAPLPGTFYQQESPTSPPFVTVGSVVAVGDQIGLIEVMKMFNPITADVAGTVVEILVASEDPVDVGQTLLRIEVAD